MTRAAQVREGKETLQAKYIHFDTGNALTIMPPTSPGQRRSICACRQHFMQRSREDGMSEIEQKVAEAANAIAWVWEHRERLAELPKTRRKALWSQIGKVASLCANVREFARLHEA